MFLDSWFYLVLGYGWFVWFLSLLGGSRRKVVLSGVFMFLWCGVGWDVVLGIDMMVIEVI